VAEKSEAKQGRVAHWREARRVKKAQKGDSPERLEEHHAPKRDWGDMVAHSAPGGSATAV
jgi:hypothetical protein